ncbi:MAG: hypothetical protein AAFN92_04840 [Bacteroidota bacterium]
MFRSLFLISLFATATACTPATTASATNTKASVDDLSGPWTLTVSTPRGSRKTDVTLVQESPTAAVGKTKKGEFPIAIDGEKLSFSREMDTPRGKVNASFTGRIESAVKLAGTMTVSGGPAAGREMAWSAVRR